MSYHTLYIYILYRISYIICHIMSRWNFMELTRLNHATVMVLQCFANAGWDLQADHRGRQVEGGEGEGEGGESQGDRGGCDLWSATTGAPEFHAAGIVGLMEGKHILGGKLMPIFNGYFGRRKSHLIDAGMMCVLDFSWGVLISKLDWRRTRGGW